MKHPIVAPVSALCAPRPPRVTSLAKDRRLPRLAAVCGLIIGVAGWTAPASAQVTSTFDTSAEGWSVADLYEQPSGPTPSVAGSYSVSYSSTGGNPGGYIYEPDPSGNSYYFQAPTKFLGNQSVSVGGKFSFDVADGPVTTLNPGESSLILVGANESIYFAESSAVNPAFTTLSFTLAPGNGGVVNGKGGASATVADFSAVLGNLQAVYVLGDYYGGNDTGKLDNVALTATGAAYGWGYNGSGQLGTTATSNSNFSRTPVGATGLSTGVTALAAGSEHSLALQYGAVYAYGDNYNGELGNGTTTQSTTPVAVTGLSSGVTALAAGAFHSLAVQNGAAYAWGANESGELGNGTATNSSVPVAVNGLTSGVTAIAGGYQHSLAIQNGAAYAWGLNSNGQLGNGTMTNSSAPMAVMGLSSGVTAIAGGFSHSLAIQNGAAYAWGANGYNQLGNGTYTNSSVPVAVTGLSNGVTSIAAGYTSSLAVQNGNVFAWGTNYNGLGNGTTTSATPVEIDPTELKNIIAVAAGEHDSYALSGDGSLWVWGDNTYGQLGLGTNAAGQYMTPQHLLPPSGYEYTAVDADAYGYFADAILTPIAVPEPATWLGGALLFGAAGLALRRRWQQA